MPEEVTDSFACFSRPTPSKDVSLISEASSNHRTAMPRAAPLTVNGHRSPAPPKRDIQSIHTHDTAPTAASGAQRTSNGLQLPPHGTLTLHRIPSQPITPTTPSRHTTACCYIRSRCPSRNANRKYQMEKRSPR